MISLAVSRAAATEADVAQALAGLDNGAGVYFGCDAGIAGMHPRQATLVCRPALALRVSVRGVRAQALGPFGHALLALPALANWQTASQPAAGRSTLDSLRAFLAAFAPQPESMLAGTLNFDAHRLARPAPAADVADAVLGVLFFPETLLQRDNAGQWSRLTLGLRAAVPAVSAPLHASPGSVPNREQPPQAVSDDFMPGGHASMVARAVQHLRSQPLVSLTLSQSFRRRFAGSPAAAFARLRAVNPAPATFFLNDGTGSCLFGASPDLQLVVNGRVVQALPVCGTVARAPGAVGEAASFRELLNEEVDAASLAICSDALRNDLAPLCVPGSLRLTERLRQMSLATVVHTVDRIEGQLREGVDAWDALAATAAPAMLTGTPRPLALAAIKTFEASPRGWYGGLMVLVRADGDALVGTILRAASIREGVAEVRTGGDLLADSDPVREERESRLKAVSLWRALGLDDAGLVQADTAGGSELPTLPQAVCLLDAGDPFMQGVRDTLLGLGVGLDAAARGPAVLAGSDAERCAQALRDRGGRGRLLAWGDAAVHVLAGAGFDVERHLPQHGRSLRCIPAAAAPCAPEAFCVGMYGTVSLATRDATMPPDWDVWASDDQGRPLALAHPAERCVCLLFRPDSLLCAPAARELLRSALAFIATAP